MARTADMSKHITITAEDLHAHDTIVCKDLTQTLTVDEAVRRNGKIKVTVWGSSTDAWTLDPARPVTVKVEHFCGCNGSGIFRGGGAVVNGVYEGFEGVCFGCGGKGWQDRADVIRNLTYWNKYARIYM